MRRHIIVLLLNLLTRVKWLITNNSNYIHPSGMTWHHMALCCIVLYMYIYLSHNTDQVEGFFSAFQLHERVRLKTRERQRKRKKKNRGTKRRREAIPNMNIFPSFTAKGPVALQPLESRSIREYGYALLSRRRMLWPVRIAYAR